MAEKKKSIKPKKAKPIKKEKKLKKKISVKAAIKKIVKKITVKKQNQKKQVSLQKIKIEKKALIRTSAKKKALVKTSIPKKVPTSIKSKEAFLFKEVENPILAPRTENSWENWQTFNPGAVLIKGKVYFLYRAIGQDGISRIGYAMSKNGLKIDERLPYPAYEHRFKERVFNFSAYFSGGSWGGCEDPRITRVAGEDVLYVTYTAIGDGEIRMALASIKIEDFLNKKWNWKNSILMSPPGQINKNWVIFPEKINGRYAVLHSLNPEVMIAYLDDLEFHNSNYIKSFYGMKINYGCWDSLIKGAGPPPIKTEEGWLLFYHAIDKKDSNKYKVGAMLLDLNDPTKVLFRSKNPILEPTELYENNGYKSGVVYVSGAVNKNGQLFIYYGGADSYVCVAKADLKEFLSTLKQEVKPKMEKQELKASRNNKKLNNFKK